MGFIAGKTLVNNIVDISPVENDYHEKYIENIEKMFIEQQSESFTETDENMSTFVFLNALKRDLKKYKYGSGSFENRSKSLLVNNKSRQI